MKQFIFPLIALIFVSATHADERIIAVTGEGSIEVPADIIAVEFIAYAESDSDASAAKASVDDIAQRTLAALVELGIQPADVISPRLSVYPHELYNEHDELVGTNYAVGRHFEVTVRNTSLYGNVIQALIDSGITTIDDVSPGVAGVKELERRALAVAVADARDRAEFLAKELDTEVGMVHQIGNQKLRRNFSLEEIIVTARKREAAGVVDYEFQPGTVDVSAEIYVEFQLR